MRCRGVAGRLGGNLRTSSASLISVPGRTGCAAPQRAAAVGFPPDRLCLRSTTSRSVLSMGTGCHWGAEDLHRSPGGDLADS